MFRTFDKLERPFLYPKRCELMHIDVSTEDLMFFSKPFIEKRKNIYIVRSLEKGVKPS